jgi:hypothetical protein
VATVATTPYSFLHCLDTVCDTPSKKGWGVHITRQLARLHALCVGLLLFVVLALRFKPILKLITALQLKDLTPVFVAVGALILVLVIQEILERLEPADPPRPDSTTNAFLEKRYRYACPCGKTMVTYDPYVLSYRCLSCRITRVNRTIKLVLACLGFAAPQSDCGENTATAVAATTDVVENR